MYQIVALALAVLIAGCEKKGSSSDEGSDSEEQSGGSSSNTGKSVSGQTRNNGFSTGGDSGSFQGGKKDSSDEEYEPDSNQFPGTTPSSLLVQSLSDLPLCNKQNDAQLIYVKASKQFMTCSSENWSNIDITGPKGDSVKGDTGPQGAMGLPGGSGLMVYDGNNNVLGQLVDTTNPFAPYSDEIHLWITKTDSSYQFVVNSDGFLANPGQIETSYTNDDCTGTIGFKFYNGINGKLAFIHDNQFYRLNGSSFFNFKSTRDYLGNCKYTFGSSQRQKTNNASYYSNLISNNSSLEYAYSSGNTIYHSTCSSGDCTDPDFWNSVKIKSFDRPITSPMRIGKTTYATFLLFKTSESISIISCSALQDCSKNENWKLINLDSGNFFRGFVELKLHGDQIMASYQLQNQSTNLLESKIAFCHTECSKLENFSKFTLSTSVSPVSNKLSYADGKFFLTITTGVPYSSSANSTLIYHCINDCGNLSNWSSGTSLPFSGISDNISPNIFENEGKLIAFFKNTSYQAVVFSCSEHCNISSSWSSSILGNYSANVYYGYDDIGHGIQYAEYEGNIIIYGIRHSSNEYKILSCSSGCNSNSAWIDSSFSQMKSDSSSYAFNGSNAVSYKGRLYLSFVNNRSVLSIASCASRCDSMDGWKKSYRVDRTFAAENFAPIDEFYKMPLYIGPSR